MLLKYSLVRNVKKPSRGHATDAGLDFFVPGFTEKFIEDLKKKNDDRHTLSWSNDPYSDESYIVLYPNSNICIPSGIKIEVPYGYMALFLNKSGVASKNELLVGAQVIDTFYSGEIHIDMHNVSDEEFLIKPGMKIVQLVLIPVLSCEPILVDEEQLYDWMKQDDYRNEGGFGSTNKNQKNKKKRRI